VLTRRLAASFDASTRSVALTEWEKFPRKAIGVSVLFSKIPKISQMPKCQHFETKILETKILITRCEKSRFHPVLAKNPDKPKIFIK